MSQVWRDQRVVLAPVSHRRSLFVEGGLRDHHPSREAGPEVVAVSADSPESHQRFCLALGGCPFPLVSDQELEAMLQYGVVGEDGSFRGRTRHRAVFVIDRGGILLHQIPWFQPGNIGQFMGIFQALGAV